MVKTGIIGALSGLLITSLGTPIDRREAPISDIRYDVTFDRTTAALREIHVEMSFDVPGSQVVSLSLPAWTPGSYELDDFAKNVRGVWAREGSADIRWDKSDFDTWRVYPESSGRVTVGFDYGADALDVGSAWSAEDFASFNGTNLFFFPEGQDLGFGAQVVVHTEREWKVVTGMQAGPGDHAYTARTYHELVDMPTFVGRFDVDSAQLGGKWYRLATYPAGAMAGANRSTMWDELREMMPPMGAVFGEFPWDTYTTLMLFRPGLGGGSALEHSNSHFGIYDPGFLGSPVLASITAHEIFHAWNVKRMRPADLWPYDYGRAMPTDLLWVSEGITDYYADLALVRGDIVGRDAFYGTTQGKIDHVAQTVPVALEDASLSTWIQPTDGTATIYYDKGSLAGLLLDILVRDASDNARSLDDVMKAVYDLSYRHGRGFTDEEWWSALQEAAGGRSFDRFHERYVDGREPFPYDEVLPLAGLELHVETSRVPRMGITTTGSEDGIRIVDVVPGSSAGTAGVQAGDDLESVGGIDVQDQSFGAVFRDRFGSRPAGTPYEIVVRRGGSRVTLQAELQFADLTTTELREAPDAGPKAIRIREGILAGTTTP